MSHLKFGLLLLICSFSLLNCKDNNAQDKSIENSISTYYFIRHAEKDRNDPTNKNPHLTDAGQARSQRWSEILKHVKFDAIYSTDFHRTKETAIPTATSNQLKLTIYNPNELDVEAFKKTNLGKNVLVVGHSNTTPALVNKFLGINKYEDIDDNNNGNLYIVTLSNDIISDMVFEIN